ncbi:MAG: ATP-dependent metallopeptidase FtsH/Yme1/Tma family protein [Calditrichaeota bacterium]|nr:ATP-dependent metallopeptidase FtsH/Yme1/Tma family protein [Calditrichota bacterium]MCB9366336.1 ATP-dependent metallopeptidase FtsH/Yme1/Tma family protein [Calditrichota bacterium]
MLLVLLVTVVVAQLVTQRSAETVITYSAFEQAVDSGNVKSGIVRDQSFHGKMKDESRFVVTLPPTLDSALLKKWKDAGIEIDFKVKRPDLGQYLLGILPWLLLLGFGVILIRRMSNMGPRGLFQFGKSKAKVYSEASTKVTFADVAGADEAKEELREIIDFLREPRKFVRVGGRIPRGVLLLGPPGTGKTLLAKAVAGEAGVPFFSISGAEFVEMFVGVGASRVRDLFETGKKNAPCIIFIDEIDAVGRHRGAGLGGGHDEREQTLNQLLIEMDGFEENDGVILVAATNRPDILDPALLRPGRFDRQIVVDRPDVRGRAAILKVHSRNKPVGDDVDLDVIAKSTSGMAGAELANLMNEAALLAARRDSDRVSMQDVEAAKDKVMMGIERRSVVIPEREKRVTAYHEAGHVLVALFSPDVDPVHKVTIIPRGQALGLTHFVPLDDKRSYSRKYLEGQLSTLLGGRVAELLVFDEVTSGASNDLKRATEIAKTMVTRWGMSEKLGPVTYGQQHEEVFLGRDYTSNQDYSDETAHAIDQAVREFVEGAEGRSRDILRRERKRLDLLAETLVERESLSGEEIHSLLDLPARNGNPPGETA